MAIRRIYIPGSERPKRAPRARRRRVDPEVRKAKARAAQERHRERHGEEIRAADRAARRTPEYLAAKAARLEEREAARVALAVEREMERAALRDWEREQRAAARAAAKIAKKPVRPRTEALIDELGGVVWHAARCPALRHVAACTCALEAPIVRPPGPPAAPSHTQKCRKGMSQGKRCICTRAQGIDQHARHCAARRGKRCSCRVEHAKRCHRIHGGACTCGAWHALAGGSGKFAACGGQGASEG